MLVEKQKIEDGSVIALWKIDETEEELLMMLDNRECVEEQISKFLSEKRRLEYIATRVLLKNIVGRELEIAYNVNGSPLVVDGTFKIGITHTNYNVAVIINPTKKVAVDIERIGDKVVRVKNKYLSKEEQHFVCVESEKIHLTIMWCIKEAMYKIVGKERVDVVSNFKISPFVPYIEGCVDAQEFCTPEMEKYTISYRVLHDICMVWVSK